MVPSGYRKIVLELILRLVRLLRHICVRAEANRAGTPAEKESRNFIVCVNQVVPVLIPDCGSINYGVAESRIESEVSKLEPVFCKVPLTQIVSLS